MLSAFKAQPIHELKPRDKSKVESLLGYGDRLLVGLNTGALRIYRVNEDSGSSDAAENGDTSQAQPKAKPVDLLQEYERFSKKPVQQLAIIKEANLLISLSDTYVSLHDLRSFELVERLEQSKGAVCFAVTSNVVKDPDTNVPGLVSRLVIGVKKKLLCWTWQDMEQISDITEITLEASVKSINWITGTRLIAGMDAGFTIVDVITEEITIVNKAAAKTSPDAGPNEPAGIRFGAVSSSGMGYMGMGSWVPKPMATGLTNGQILVAKDVNTLFIDTDGKPLDKRQVPWSFAPEAVGYSYPYLLALQAPDKGSLHIRNPDTLSLLQAISVPGANILHVPPPNISLAHAGKGFLVASERAIWRMSPLPYHTQIAELVAKQRFDEAISLLNLLEDTLLDDKAGRIREIKIEKGTAQFSQQNYRSALDLFTEAEAPPQRIVALYPPSIAGTLVDPADDAAEGGEVAGETEETVKTSPSTPSKTVFGMWKGGSKRIDPDTASIISSARNDTDNVSIRSKQPARGEDKSLEGDNLKTAVRCLCSFLAQARVQIQKYLTTNGTLKENPPQFDSETGKPPFANLLPAGVFDRKRDDVDWQEELLEVAKMVDTTLFRAYMLALPSLAGSLFRLDNFCDPEVVQSILYENERYADLIDFLRGKRLHRQALEMLSKFGQGEANGQIPEGMRGVEPTVSYLQQLPPDLIDLILEFGKWPVKEDPVAGMEIFIADNNHAGELPRWKVAKFLEGIDNRLEVQYIEHIIHEWTEADPDFHQRLIDLYLTRLKEENLDDDARNDLKEKVEAFLQESKVYHKPKTFAQLPADNPIFYEARAIVLSATGDYKQALAIYVFKIKDYDKAEKYCSKVYVEKQASAYHDGAKTLEKSMKQFEPEDTPDKPNPFAILLSLYLRPPVNEEKRWPQALELLAKHGARLPTGKTLDLMPDDLAVEELQDYFRGRIRNATSILREKHILQNLEEVRRARAEQTLMLGSDSEASRKPSGRNRRIRISEDDHCKVCHKRFGASAVRVYPNNEVVHYGCVSGAGRESGNSRPGDGGFAHMRQSSGWR